MESEQEEAKNFTSVTLQFKIRWIYHKQSQFTLIQPSNDDEYDPNEQWTNIKETYQNAGNLILGKYQVMKRKKMDLR